MGGARISSLPFAPLSPVPAHGQQQQEQCAATNRQAQLHAKGPVAQGKARCPGRHREADEGQIGTQWL